MTEPSAFNSNKNTETVYGHCNVTVTWGYSKPDVRIVAYILAFSPVLVLTMNCIASLYIIRARRLKLHTRLLLFSISAADILVATIVMPFRLYDMLNYRAMNDPICNVGNSFDVFLSFVSMLSMTVLAFDRYITTCKPFHIGYWFRKRNMVGMLILTWGFPAIFTFVFIPLKLSINSVGFKRKCLAWKTKSCLFFAKVPYGVSTAILFSFLSAIIIICNKHTMHAIKKKTEIFYRVIFSTKPIPVYRRHHGSKTARMVIRMTLCFMLCWLPFFIVIAVDPLLGYRIPQYIWIVARWIAYMNCVLNPLLFLISAGVLKLK